MIARVTNFLSIFGFTAFFMFGAWYNGEFERPKYMMTCTNGEQVILKSDKIENLDSTFTTYSFDYEGKHFVMPIAKCTLVK